jgi:hypothetical protein
MARKFVYHVWIFIYLRLSAFKRFILLRNIHRVFLLGLVDLTWHSDFSVKLYEIIIKASFVPAG